MADSLMFGVSVGVTRMPSFTIKTRVPVSTGPLSSGDTSSAANNALAMPSTSAPVYWVGFSLPGTFQSRP